MCLSVNYYCICGVVARTKNVVCSTSLIHPLPPQYEEIHQLRQLSMILPREEWNARKGTCPQKGCPQNHTPTADVTVTKYKCPGCSTLCGGSFLPSVSAFEKELRTELERDFSDMDIEDDSNDYFEEPEKEIEQGSSNLNVEEHNGDFFEKEPGKALERKLSNMDVELDVNRAEFLDRALWHTYHCPVDFCPFNMNSMAEANENLSSILGEMQRVIEDSVSWTSEEDDQILALSSDGADEDLIADIVGRAVADIRERFTYLGLLREVLK